MILTINGTEVILVREHTELLQCALYEKAEKLFASISRQLYKSDRYMKEVVDAHKLIELYRATGKDPHMLENKLAAAMIASEKVTVGSA